MPLYLAIIAMIVIFTGMIWWYQRARNGVLLKASIAHASQNIYEPQATIVAFDIHGVLFKNDYWAMIKEFLKSPYKYRCMRYGLYPWLWIDYCRLTRAGYIFEWRIACLIDKYPALQPCLPLFMAIANAQKPVEAVMAIVRQLQVAGYELHIISNIGESFGADLQQRYPEVFKYFTLIKTPTHEQQYKSKRHGVVFKAYLREYNRDSKQVVLIDDSPQSLHVAAGYGITGIYCVRAEKLAEILRLHGGGISKSVSGD